MSRFIRSLFCLAMSCAMLLFSAMASQAQTFTALWNFGDLNLTGAGRYPAGPLVQDGEGTLYGATDGGDEFHPESSGPGGLFRIPPDGNGFTVLKWFTNSVDGVFPLCPLALSGSVLYGTTEFGGSSDYGTLFRINTDGTGYTVLNNFTDHEGRPNSGIMLFSGVLYGTTYDDSVGQGTVFKINTDGTGRAVLKIFSDSTTETGNQPFGPLTLSGGVLYGATQLGGSSGYGTLFRINTDGTGFSTLKSFMGGNEDDGDWPNGGLILSSNVLYGTTRYGGSFGSGTVFRINTNGTGFSTLKNVTGCRSCSNSEGIVPYGGLTLASNVLYGAGFGYLDPFGQVGLGTIFKINTDGTDYAVVKTFIDDSHPLGGLVLSSNVLYGTTHYGGGGSSGWGAVFKINTDGTSCTVLKGFASVDGQNPSYVGLTLSSNVLYGTTASGGGSNSGTVFKIKTDGTGYMVLKSLADGLPNGGVTLYANVLYGSAGQTVFKLKTDGTGYAVLKTFTDDEALNINGGLTLADSVIYGTTYNGGSAFSEGTVFKINTDGTGFSTLKNFNGGDDGWGPQEGLVLSSGILYGTSFYGGSSENGMVFKINTDGRGYAALHYFNVNDALNINGGLTLVDNVLYGTSQSGGSFRSGTVFKVNTDGTGYSLLKSFNSGDGANPAGGLIIGDSVLYGTTWTGGKSAGGTVFRINTDGTGYEVLKNFTGSDGAYPAGGLMLSNNMLYGTASQGGRWDSGTLFRIDLRDVPLNWRATNNALILDWANPALSLQTAPIVNGVFTNVPGAATPHTNSLEGPHQFFRLNGN